MKKLTLKFFIDQTNFRPITISQHARNSYLVQFTRSRGFFKRIDKAVSVALRRFESRMIGEDDTVICWGIEAHFEGMAKFSFGEWDEKGVELDDQAGDYRGLYEHFGYYEEFPNPETAIRAIKDIAKVYFFG